MNQDRLVPFCVLMATLVLACMLNSRLFVKSNCKQSLSSLFVCIHPRDVSVFTTLSFLEV